VSSLDIGHLAFIRNILCGVQCLDLTPLLYKVNTRMSVIPKKPKRVLSVFSLVMINVIAVDSLRSLPISAAYGFSIVFYYLLAAILFFVPVALIAAELATAWPETGGLYVWVREAFGRRWGFFYDLVAVDLQCGLVPDYFSFYCCDGCLCI